MVRTKRRRAPQATRDDLGSPQSRSGSGSSRSSSSSGPRSLPAADPQPGDVLEQRMAVLQRGIKRLIDSYQDGLIEKEEFEPRFGFRR